MLAGIGYDNDQHGPHIQIHKGPYIESFKKTFYNSESYPLIRKTKGYQRSLI